MTYIDYKHNRLYTPDEVKAMLASLSKSLPTAEYTALLRPRKVSPTEWLDRYIDQTGVRPGFHKYLQFRQALLIRDTPPLRSQDRKGDKAIAHVKLFDPCSQWTWYISEWDGDDTVFCLCCGFDTEYGYSSLSELAQVEGAYGVGIEIETYSCPTPFNELSDKRVGAYFDGLKSADDAMAA